MSLTKNERKDTVGTCALLGNLEVSCENDLSLSLALSLLLSQLVYTMKDLATLLENFSPRVKVDFDSYRFPHPSPFIVLTLYLTGIIVENAVDHCQIAKCNSR